MTSNFEPVCFPGMSDIIDSSCMSKVRMMTFHGVSGSAGYASVRWNNLSGSIEERTRAKCLLISELLKKGLNARHYSHKVIEKCCSPSTAELSYSPLGKPRLVLDDHEEQRPSVSFSHLDRRTWVALCYYVQGVGIDAASADEFRDAYPYARAFHQEELDLAADLGCQDQAEIAALIWAAKEATVKALGCGFHLLDPLDVRIALPQIHKCPDGLGMVALIGHKPNTIGGAQKFLQVKIVREFECWVAIAVTNKDSLP